MSNLKIKNTANDSVQMLLDTSVIMECNVNEFVAKTVTSISQLATASTTGAVNVLNYHSGLEGGGGVFYWDATGNATEHNGGTVISPLATFPTDWNNQTQLATWFNGSGLVGTGVWRRQYDGAVNVKWFGAKGDGVTDDTNSVSAALNSGLICDGGGLIFKVSAIPSDFSKLKNFSFVDGTKAVKVTKDFFDIDVRKVTNTHQYTAWAQDKAYVLSNQIKVWAMEAEAHTSATIKPICYVSDDGGNSFTCGEYLDEKLENHTVWSAGIDDVYEYVIVRDDSTAPDYIYSLYKRPIPTTDFQSTNWSITTLSFPAGHTNPVMVHSFCYDGSGIVVAHHDGAGCGLFRSTDRGVSWTNYDLYISSNGEEATVKYDSISGRYLGFIRAGGVGNNPKFWVSAVNNLATIDLYTAPSGYFGVNTLEDCPIPLVVDAGTLYATVAYRNGTLEGNASDKTASVFLIKATLADGDNIWSHADTYRLGHLYHAETGGASALGVGSVVKYQDTIKIYFGNEERTGTGSTHNRIANIFQVSIKLKENDGIIDYRTLPYQVPMSKTDIRLLDNYDGHLIESKKFVKKGYRNFSTAYKSNIDSFANGMFMDAGKDFSGNYVLFSDQQSSGYTIVDPNGTHGMYMNGANLAFRYGGVERFRWDGVNTCLSPTVDNTGSIGRSARRWSVIYSATGTINTSDAREKIFLTTTEAETLVAKDLKQLMKKFKFNDAIEAKGDKARIHYGTSAQEVVATFEKHGLNAMEYAMVCYDEWDEQPEELNEEGNVVVEYRPAGDRYGIRYEELLCFIISAM